MSRESDGRELPALNPLTDVATVAQIIGDFPHSPDETRDAVKEQFAFREQYNGISEPLPSPFSHYHFVRGVNSLSLPTLALRAIFQRSDRNDARSCVRLVTHPWGAAGQDVLEQVDDDFAHWPAAPDGACSHVVVFHFEGYLIVWAIHSKPRREDDKMRVESPIAALSAGVSEGRYFRFTQIEGSGDSSRLVAFAITEETDGKKVIVRAHRVL